MNFRPSASHSRRQSLTAGVDEAGRGPLAGPVVAAAVILREPNLIEGLDDSKKLSPARREALAAEISNGVQAYAIAWADRAEIDACNVLNATLLAMRRAILGLSIQPVRVLVDGNRLPDLKFNARQIEGEAIVGGDGLIPSIGAASILAKVTRDRMMRRMDAYFPGYGFARHKGYGTAEHRHSILRLGPCEAHRLSFRPLRKD